MHFRSIVLTFSLASAPALAQQTFRIEPVRPIDEIREEALAATPPAQPEDLREPDLVELTDLDPSIRLEIRYASDDNFMGVPLYRQARAFLQRSAAEALVRVHRKLSERGLGLLVYDAYRPWFVTKMFWEATPDHQKNFVASPENGSIHNRGAAVDLTLYDRETGEALPMPSGYDEFTERAHSEYEGGTDEERRNREILRKAMEAEGFEVYADEWWHFNHRTADEYPVLNRRFDELE